MAELLQKVQPSLSEQLADPQVSLSELLTQSGFEGMPPEGRLELVENATLDDFKKITDIIHRKVAPDDSPDPHPTAMRIKGDEGHYHYTATPEERVGILSKALENAKQVVAKYRTEGGDLTDALQRCGNLAAFGVVLAHIYEGGSGRTARAVGELIHNGYDSTDPTSVAGLAIASANRPTTGYRINSYVAVGEWAGHEDAQPLDFLDVVAGLQYPLDGHSYRAAAPSAFTTPRM